MTHSSRKSVSDAAGLSLVQAIDQTFRCNQSVTVGDEVAEFFPVEIRAVQVHPDPALLPDVRRYEKAVSIRRDQDLGRASRRFQPQRGPPAVVVALLHREDA